MSTLSFGARVVRSAWRMTPQRALSEAIGWGARRSLPRSLRAPFLREFARQYGIDVNEAEKPLEGYTGLQEFFTRRLRADARPLASAPDAIVAPSDGTVVECGFIRGGASLQAKCRGFSLPELVGDEALAARLEGGAFLTTYLSPRDYHRVHVPVTGRVLSWTHVPGRLFPVNARSVLREPDLFSRNERFVTLLESAAGLYVVVMVAAVGVGHITASYDDGVATHRDGFSGGEIRRRDFEEPVPLARGDELGIFNLGSTTIVVFEPDRALLDDLQPGSQTRMGAAIGRILPRA